MFWTRSARLPVSSRSRERSSSQIDTPAAVSSFSRSDMLPPSRGHGCSGAGGGDAVLRRLRNRLGGDAVLGEDAGEVGGRAVLLDRHDPPGVPDDLTPA